MEHRFFIILYCLERFKGERSIFAIYHLLKGKKSSQTIQDGKLYHLSFLFQTISDLTREELRLCIDYFLRKKLIKPLKEDVYFVTPHGKELLEKKMVQFPFPEHLQGWEFGTEAILFWKRFSLLTQCLSHLLLEKYSFRPITKELETQRWVKYYLSSHRENRKDLAKQLTDECLTILSRLKSRDAEIFTMRLTSSHRIGLTFEQIAEIYKLDKSVVAFQFQHSLHFFMKEIKKNPTSYPYLYQMIEDNIEDIPLTKSTNYTFSLLKKGLTIEEIASVRRIRQSTVEDHIVEITLNDKTFSINSFVDPSLQEEIIKVSAVVGERKLKPIWEKLDKVSYFQIRLVLAMRHHQNEMKG